MFECGRDRVGHRRGVHSVVQFGKEGPRRNSPTPEMRRKVRPFAGKLTTVVIQVTMTSEEKLDGTVDFESSATFAASSETLRRTRFSRCCGLPGQFRKDGIPLQDLCVLDTGTMAQPIIPIRLLCGGRWGKCWPAPTANVRLPIDVRRTKGHTVFAIRIPCDVGPDLQINKKRVVFSFSFGRIERIARRSRTLCVVAGFRQSLKVSFVPLKSVLDLFVG